MKLLDLKKYITQCLGAPVIQVEIANEQLDNIINSAVQKFQEQHYDGTQEAIYKLPVIPNTQEYVLPEYVQSVLFIFPISELATSNLLIPVSSLDVFTSQSIDVGRWESIMQKLGTIEWYFRQEFIHDFSETSKKLTIFKKITENNLYGLKIYKKETDLERIYNNLWFKDYVVALAKIQWGQNLKKYSGTSLPGGTQLNGDTIYNDGVNEKEKQLELLETKYSEVPEFYLG